MQGKVKVAGVTGLSILVLRFLLPRSRFLPSLKALAAYNVPAELMKHSQMFFMGMPNHAIATQMKIYWTSTIFPLKLTSDIPESANANSLVASDMNADGGSTMDILILKVILNGSVSRIA